MQIELQQRDWKTAIVRGGLKRCPSCGKGRLFTSYLDIAEGCPSCSEPLHHQRADDAPPYFTIFVVGHIVIPMLLVVEKLWHPELWIHFVVWLPLTLLLTLWLLPVAKGATVGLQWALRMHGFANETDVAAAAPPHAVTTP
jgi:uncharacterized protein (DUF983 family)